MNLVDRILTIVVTATITSAIWIVAGGSLIENATSTTKLRGSCSTMPSASTTLVSSWYVARCMPLMSPRSCSAVYSCMSCVSARSNAHSHTREAAMHPSSV